MSQSARTIYERWLEYKNMLNPAFVAVVRNLNKRQALKWCEKARACGMGGVA